MRAKALWLHDLRLIVTDPWIVLGAVMLEAIVGYPNRLQALLPHPVVWIGKLIGHLDAKWNAPSRTDQQRKRLGIACLCVIVTIASFAGVVLEWTLSDSMLGIAALLLLATLGLAQRSLYQHVAAVLTALEAGNLPAAQHAVGYVVGRDTANLDEHGVASAALETLAESFNDGVVAPVFWFVLGGLPGLFIYKAVNTADSMIGHKELRWRDFGWASARFDDALNLIPARLTGAFIAGPSASAWRTMWVDASKHASPNAGWPEAAMAGALNVQLGGAIRYDGVAYDRPTFGQDPLPTTHDLRRGLGRYVAACGIMWILLLAGGELWRH